MELNVQKTYMCVAFVVKKILNNLKIRSLRIFKNYKDQILNNYRIDGKKRELIDDLPKHLVYNTMK